MVKRLMSSTSFRGMIVSASLHAALLVLLSLIVFQAKELPDHPLLTTSWADQESLQEPLSAVVSVIEPDALDPLTKDQTRMDQGGSAEVLLAEDRLSMVDDLILEANPSMLLELQPAVPGAVAKPARNTKASGKNRTGGSGNGKGVGKGSGRGAAGQGIFTRSSAARKVVYVVDCSLSMNAPHPPTYYRTGVPATRFQRVQLELVQAVETLPEETEFSIVFFSDRAFAMPGEAMVVASQENKVKVLKWVASSMTMSGGTDPREALSVALKMEPQVIYLLSDGSFHPVIQQDLLKLQQDRIQIHTIALGESAAETVLKQISDRNRGEFSFVP